MSTNELNFDATSVAPQKPLEPLPTGWYTASIDESEVHEKDNGQGGFNKRLALRFTVQGGEHDGKKIFTSLNHTHTNPVAQKIAQEQLSAICHATGEMRITNTQVLHGKPMQIRAVYVAPDVERGYDAKNDIKGYKPAEGAGAAASMPAGMVGGAAPVAAAPVAAALPPVAAAIPAALPPVAAPVAAPTVPSEPNPFTEAEGWIQHPSSAPHVYKGSEVITHEELKAKADEWATTNAAPVAAPVAPSAEAAVVAPTPAGAPWELPKA